MSPNGKDIFAKKWGKAWEWKKFFSPQPGWGKCWFVLERAVFTFVLDVDSPRVRTFPHNFPGGISGWRLCCLAFPILPVIPHPCHVPWSWYLPKVKYIPFFHKSVLPLVKRMTRICPGSEKVPLSWRKESGIRSQNFSVLGRCFDRIAEIDVSEGKKLKLVRLSV